MNFLIHSPIPSNFFPLRFKYPSQDLIVEHHQVISFPQNERPIFTPVYNYGLFYALP